MIVSVIVQIWIFLGSQIYRSEMRSFRLPTRIDGCIALRGNVTLALDTMISSALWNETSTTSGLMQTVVKYVESFLIEKLISELC